MPYQNKPTRQAPVTRSASADTSKVSPEKRATPSRRKRRRSRTCSSSSATTNPDELEDQTLDETIQRCADMNNLTPECIRKLLKKLVMNEHVLAIVKLKEEEVLPQSDSGGDGDGEGEGDDEDEELNSLQPKLTRLKAKQLNKQPLPIVPLKAPIPDEEVAALIREELGSDDDDEEYKPTEGDISDDDPNNTISDIDSQPRTPATPAQVTGTEADDANAQLYTKDGLFKIPRARNDSNCSYSEQEQENIARRTRSKLCLQTTAIETIESTFIPPDITTDMYEFDCDMDHVWKEFLNEFTKPLPNNAEDDDDTDPEYVAAEKIPMDPEELREVKVSKKELNELVSELLEMSGIMDESYLDETVFNDALANENNSQKQDEQTSLRSTESSQIHTPQPEESGLSMHEQSSCLNGTVNYPVFQPTAMSTPTVLVVNRQTESNTITPSVALTYPPSIASTQITDRPNGQMSSSTFRSPNGTTQGQYFIQVSKPDESSFREYYQPSYNNVPAPVEERPFVKPSERKYRYLYNVLPAPIIFPEGHQGFTDFQLQLFHQQLRIHVQLAAQSFMQSYAHPKFWRLATSFKQMLLDLQEASSTNPAIKAFNLDVAIECCTSWEDELQLETSENNEMIQYLLEEAEKAEKAKQNGKYYQGGFHPKLMEKIINCTAFMYPKLLPYTPFRMDFRAEKRIIRAEERLFAFGLEMFYPIAKEELDKHKPTRGKTPTIQQVCRFISRYLCPLHTDGKIYAYVISRRHRATNMNPIKYYFLHAKALPYQHTLESIDLNNVIPPAAYQCGILPHLWDKYLYSNARLAKINGYTVQKTAESQPEELACNQEQSNVNITVSIVLDAQQSSYNESKGPLYINPLFLDPTYDLKGHRNNKSSPKEDYESAVVGVEPNKWPDQPTAVNNSIKNSDDSPEITHANGQDVLKKLNEPSPCCNCNCHKTNESTDDDILKRRLGKGQKKVTDYFQLALKSQVSVNVNDLKEKLWEIYQRFRNSYEEHIVLGNYVSQRVLKHFKLIEGFSYFLDDLKEMSSSHAMKKVEGETQKNENCFSNASVHKMFKFASAEEKDSNYAYNFLEKVEKRLLDENKHAQFKKFLEILQTFNEKDRVADLYYKIESLLVADHPDLVDLFLTFLLPGQAAEVGKFFEHFILTNANDFLTKLNIYFAKQPSQIKKIYSCLNDLSNEKNVTMDLIKLRILPLLKGNPLLIEWFLQLFPSEKPPESSLSDHEVISTKKLSMLDSPDAIHTYEEVSFGDIPSESTGESTICGTKYIQGRIIYGTLPARLSFLAHNCTISPSQNGISQPKGCMHNVNVRNVEKSRQSADCEDQNHTQDENQETQRYKLCDDTTFKAHAIRLNPLVHSGKGINYSDVAHLLIPESGVSTESNSSVEQDKQTSPKKQQMKTLIKKRINSPVNKKPSLGKSSPTTNKKAPQVTPSDSGVISVSKKLKSMIDESSGAGSDKFTQASSPLTMKRKPVAMSTPSVPVPTKKEKIIKKPSVEQSLPENKTEACEPKEKSSTHCWTRDEDKVILEEIKSGYSTVDELVDRIGRKIENRNFSEIKDRYEFLMDVLKKVQRAN
ncbi:uncharacterized protein LOC129775376 [Toxorhynchites rutilus septentrionalis]|uniref:uncharacterized protein LOC129775376 n=1 Tax=Toxorhynchites rutilus septentrionalis TaxID=329112 RepID=UPI002479CB6C|nr:uncharacterized protein LOC129775376 [Toxorhynchites rutilus septentrionalis]